MFNAVTLQPRGAAWTGVDSPPKSCQRIFEGRVIDGRCYIYFFMGIYRPASLQLCRCTHFSGEPPSALGVGTPPATEKV
jgi:hypothetical protein